MADEDEDAICKKCGARAEEHHTRWIDGIPVVGSYKNAPNGRICSLDVNAIELKNDEFRELAMKLSQKVHDMGNHFGSFPFCMQDPCLEAFQKLSAERKRCEKQVPVGDFSVACNKLLPCQSHGS